MKHVKKFIFFITTLFVMIGFVGVQPANADTSITVESVSYSDATASANVTKEERALINGATQLTWWYPNHSIAVSKKSVRNAPHIKVRYTTCANQSKSIAKQARGKSIVVAMPGSVICNTGKNGNIIGGFKWTVQRPAVLKWNRSLRLYQHVYDVYGSAWKVSKMTLVKTCGNRMGGHVDQMYNQVVQVRYESDVQLDISIQANASVKAKVEASLQCDSGKLYGYAEASASAAASATIHVKSGVKVSAINAKKIELLNQVNASAKAKAEAEAKAKITLTCTDTPSYSAPVISANASPCTQQGQQPGIVTVSAKNDNNVTVPVTYSFPGKDTKTGSIAAGQTGTVEFTGVLPGTYTVSVSFGAPVNKSVTTQVTVAKCEVPPAPPTIVDMTRPNDTNPGWTTPACATADFPQGHSGTLFFSFESGTVSGTNPVQVNDLQQGCVTLISPTEEGWYTYTVTATDSVTGLSVSKTSQAYHVYATPPPA